MGKGRRENNSELAQFNRIDRHLEEEREARKRGDEIKAPEENKLPPHKVIKKQEWNFSPNTFMKILGGYQTEYKAEKKKFDNLKMKFIKTKSDERKVVASLRLKIDDNWNSEKDDILILTENEKWENEITSRLAKISREETKVDIQGAKVIEIGEKIKKMDLNAFLKMEKLNNE